MRLESATQVIDKVAAMLKADNDKAARYSDAEFTNLLRDYVTNPRKQYLYGGVVNLLSSVAACCEELSEIEGDDWERAAQAIDDCSEAVDFKYGAP